jgi:hypothetical protein
MRRAPILALCARGQLAGDSELLTREPGDARTPDEDRFLAAFPSGPPYVDVWPRADTDGSPWLCLSMDLLGDGMIWRTLRVDFDGITIKGGVSPAHLNWDDGVRAAVAGIDTNPPLGFAAAVTTPEEAAGLVADWFRSNQARGHQ